MKLQSLGALLFLVLAGPLPAQIILSDSGDTFVSQHVPTANYHNASDQTSATDLLEVKKDLVSGDYNRLAYIQFDLSAYTPSEISDATLTLNFGPLAGGTVTAGSTWTLDLYGLNSAAVSSASGLGVGSMTWNNTVTSGGFTGFHNATGTGVINATLLGTITVTTSGSGTVWNTTGVNLDSYLQGSGTTAAFVLNRITDATNGNGIQSIYNSTAGSLAPKLTFTVPTPEPNSAMLIVTGIAVFAFMIVRRQSFSKDKA